MMQVLDQVEQRDQHEGTAADTRMRHLQRWLVQYLIVVEQEVNVDQPWPP